MFNKSCRSQNRKPWAKHGMAAMKPSGNSAFDAYKEDTLRRLEQEQSDFESFMQRLREAKDKAEFDQFMDERSTMPSPEASDEESAEKSH